MKDKNKMSMTIYIPFYYGEQFIYNALDSIVSQDIGNVRVKILYQDGKNSFEDLKHGIKFKNAEIIDTSFAKSIGENWNIALKDNDSNEFFMIMHQDDILLKNYCSEMINFLKANPDFDMAYCDNWTIDSKSRISFYWLDVIKRIFRIKVMTWKNIKRIMFPIITCPTMCFRRSSLKGQFFREDLLNELDNEYWVRAVLLGKKIGYLNKRLYMYRRSGANESLKNTNNGVKYFEILQLFELFKGLTNSNFIYLIIYYILLIKDLLKDSISFRISYKKLRFLVEPFKSLNNNYL